MKFMNKESAYIKPKLGVIATSEPNAAYAGLEILKKGGNAIDAAIATAAALTVTEPTSNGIGGDNFAILWHKDKLIGMNSSGRSPELLSIDQLRKRGLTEIPTFGFVPVTVPGVVKGWVELSKKYGKLDFKEVLKPAIKLARDGYKIAPTVQYYWDRTFKIYEKKLDDPMFKHWFDTFGKVPQPGETVYLKDHAKTLEDIANTYGKTFYHGDIAEQIDAFSKKHDGFIRKSDLEKHKAEWVKPISTNYRGYDIYELPPNTQGIIGLMGLNILENYDFKSKSILDIYHTQIESTKLAFNDGLKYIADPHHMEVTVESLLSKSYAKSRYQEIKDNAINHTYGEPNQHGTVYLATSDSEGNMVSLIQSNYMGFGSGLVVPNTGIALQNRGHNFSYNPKSVNVLAPNKKPYHTIIPGFIMKNHKPVGPFGVMGGFMQPQGHLQVVSSLIDLGLTPQEALDRPRYQWFKDKTIYVEPSLDQNIVQNLIKKGHQVEVKSDLGVFGRGQIILNINQKTYVATEKRCDGTIASK